MSLLDIMINQIATARHIVEDHAAEVIPAWHISTPEGRYLIFTRFDHDKPEQRERALFLISRFMLWKMATSFVLTVETWLGSESTRSGEEALLVVGVSRHQRAGLLQRITGRDPPSFGTAEWLTPDQIDEAYFGLLPTGSAEITTEEIAELTSIFGKNGEMEAERLG
jgi:hypothetical protein